MLAAIITTARNLMGAVLFAMPYTGLPPAACGTSS